MTTKKTVKTAATGLQPLVDKKPTFQMGTDNGKFDVYLLRTYFCTISSDKIAEFQAAFSVIQKLHGL